MAESNTPPPLDEARLEAIRERADAATPGPWHIHLGFIWPEYAAPYHEDHDDSITGWTNRDADRTFIANAREDIPALLAAYDRLRAREAAAMEVTRNARAIMTFARALLNDAEVYGWHSDSLTRIATLLAQE